MTSEMVSVFPKKNVECDVQQNNQGTKVLQYKQSHERSGILPSKARIALSYPFLLH